MPRNRIPTTIKLARGTYRRDRDGGRGGDFKAAPLKIDSPPPDGLNQYERTVWKRILEVLVPHNLATDLDVFAIVGYCEDEWLRQSLRKDISEQGLILKGDRGSKHNQAFSALDQVRRRQMSFWAKFGMTPSDRAGLAADFGPHGRVSGSCRIQQRDRSE
jgi:P27 family predicted phage terminase small subunit